MKNMINVNFCDKILFYFQNFPVPSENPLLHLLCIPALAPLQSSGKNNELYLLWYYEKLCYKVNVILYYDDIQNIGLMR